MKTFVPYTREMLQLAGTRQGLCKVAFQTAGTLLFGLLMLALGDPWEPFGYVALALVPAFLLIVYNANRYVVAQHRASSHQGRE